MSERPSRSDAQSPNRDSGPDPCAETPTASPESDEALLNQAAEGDRDAFTELLKRHSPAVQAGLLRKIPKSWQSVLSADDVMQVTYLEAFLGIEWDRPGCLGSFQNWLSKIAENNLRDALRMLEADKRPNPRMRVMASDEDDSLTALYESLAGTKSTPSRAAARNEAKAALEKALEYVPGDYRLVVRLYDLQGQSAEEVAATLNRSVGAVYMLRARAIDRLRGLLGGGGRILSDSA